MRDTLYTDTETYCDIPLKHGTVAYSVRVEVMLMSYALNEEPSRVWDRTAGPMPNDLDDMLNSDALLIAHNSFFDRTMLNANGFGLAYDLAVERWRCTMVQAFAHGLPGKLETLGVVLGIPEDHQKLKTGRDHINLFCKPRPKNSKIRRATRETHPKEWAEFVEYSRVDTEALREVHKRLPTWNYPDNERELNLWFLDQHINDRGVALDLDLARGAVRAVAREKIRLAGVAGELTDDILQSTAKRDRLLGYLLAEHGVNLPDLQASTLERRIDDHNLPDDLRELLRIRLESNMTSQTKYKRALECVSPDGRARGLLQFAGAARTERWAGRTLQPQNFVRPTLPAEEIAMWIEAITSGAEDLL